MRIEHEYPQFLTLKGIKYNYIGDIPTLHRYDSRRYWGQRGHRVSFKEDIVNPKVTLMYVSMKSFDDLKRKYGTYGVPGYE